MEGPNTPTLADRIKPALSARSKLKLLNQNQKSKRQFSIIDYRSTISSGPYWILDFCLAILGLRFFCPFPLPHRRQSNQTACARTHRGPPRSGEPLCLHTLIYFFAPQNYDTQKYHTTAPIWWLPFTYHRNNTRHPLAHKAHGA